MMAGRIFILLLLFCASGSECLWAQKSQAEKGAGKELSKSELKKAKGIYNKYACHSCHGDNGKLSGDLTGAYLKYNDEQLVSYIKDASSYNNVKMPVYRDVIAAADYPVLVAYIRQLGRREAERKK